MNQWTSEPQNQWINESVVNGSMIRWVSRWNGSTIQWVNESVNQRIIERLSHYEPLYQWTKQPNEPMNQWILPTSFCKKCSDPHRFLRFQSAKQEHWSANQTLATVWCTFYQLHLPKVLRSHQVFAFWNANRTLTRIWCTFGRSHLPRVLRTWQFFAILRCKSSPVHFLSATLPDRAPNPRKQRPYFGDPTRKKHRVSRPIVFSPVNSHASDLLHFLTTW